MRIMTAREAAARLRVGMPAGDVLRLERRAASIPDINAASASVAVVRDRLREAHAGLRVEAARPARKGRSLYSH